MTTVLETNAADVAGGGLRRDRNMDQARQGNWLLQLERALLAQDVKTSNAPSPQSHHEYGGNCNADHGDVRDATKNVAADVRGRGKLEWNQQSHAAVRQGTEFSKPQGEPMEADSFGESERPAYADNGRQDGLTPVQMQKTSHEPANTGADDESEEIKRIPDMSPGGAPASLSAFAPLATGPLQANAAYLPLASVAAMAPVVRHAGETETVQRNFATQELTPLSTRVMLGAAAWNARSAEQPSRTELGRNEEMTANARKPLMPDGDEYAARKLHLYRADEGVHAWIRDASLSGAQALAIFQAMHSSLGSSGEKLVALTLNGKRVAGTLDADANTRDGDVQLPTRRVESK